ncbi:uncharacterized protein LOC128628474 [Artibeus jamaicensis]|uniref:uncharacterized protein LOC128628474 n=1 Tax=Artibeus jamaicensis TaxID=9417 RepID=UPI00235AF6F5|nr:uncharacterized protein LOC128628474 [Artibeus jamaicensis]
MQGVLLRAPAVATFSQTGEPERRAPIPCPECEGTARGQSEAGLPSLAASRGACGLGALQDSSLGSSHLGMLCWPSPALKHMGLCLLAAVESMGPAVTPEAGVLSARQLYRPASGTSANLAPVGVATGDGALLTIPSRLLPAPSVFLALHPADPDSPSTYPTTRLLTPAHVSSRSPLGHPTDPALTKSSRPPFPQIISLLHPIPGSLPAHHPSQTPRRHARHTPPIRPQSPWCQQSPTVLRSLIRSVRQWLLGTDGVPSTDYWGHGHHRAGGVSSKGCGPVGGGHARGQSRFKVRRASAGKGQRLDLGNNFLL